MMLSLICVSWPKVPWLTTEYSLPSWNLTGTLPALAIFEFCADSGVDKSEAPQTTPTTARARFHRHGYLPRAVVDGGRIERRGTLRPGLLQRPRSAERITLECSRAASRLGSIPAHGGSGEPPRRPRVSAQPSASRRPDRSAGWTRYLKNRRRDRLRFIGPSRHLAHRWQWPGPVATQLFGRRRAHRAGQRSPALQFRLRSAPDAQECPGVSSNRGF